MTNSVRPKYDSQHEGSDMPATHSDERYFLRDETVRRLARRRHKNLCEVASALNISRSYWSQLLTGARHLTPPVRSRILACPVFEGVSEDELWVVVPAITGCEK
ncbi:MAG: helix-turn-helix transcriptional regulator [Pseudomonadota bacterium]|nr:helix-turn-helix transcriptional regulator [Pseudomonadota bacterium]